MSPVDVTTPTPILFALPSKPRARSGREGDGSRGITRVDDEARGASLGMGRGVTTPHSSTRAFVRVGRGMMMMMTTRGGATAVRATTSAMVSSSSSSRRASSRRASSRVNETKMMMMCPRATTLKTQSVRATTTTTATTCVRSDARPRARVRSRASSSSTHVVAVDDGGFGGGGSGNDDDARGFGGDDDEDGDDSEGGRGRGGVVAMALVTVVATMTTASSARAVSATASSRGHERRSRKLADMSTSAMYGFVAFYGIKIALKRLFAPVLLFVGTTQLLFRMRALKISPGMMYESFVKPYLPVEYQKNLQEFSAGALKSKAARNAMHDGWWDKQERRFWTCAHRLLPACDSPMGERAFVFGVILAGLA